MKFYPFFLTGWNYRYLKGPYKDHRAIHRLSDLWLKLCRGQYILGLGKEYDNFVQAASTYNRKIYTVRYNHFKLVRYSLVKKIGA